MSSRHLPDRPHLDQLRKQAKDLQKERRERGDSVRLGEAQRALAVEYGFPTWAALVAQVQSIDLAAQLKLAIDTDDVEQVRALLTDHPELHRAKMGYGGDGPLTWAAECRGMGAPSARRLAIVQLMLELGAHVHQGGDGPLMRASLGERLPMMELLIRHGADVNALWHGSYPMVCGPCECLDPVSLRFLLDHGADPNRPSSEYGYPLDMAIGTYGRSPAQHACVEALVEAGAKGKFRDLASLPIHRGRLDLLAADLDADPELVHRRFPALEYGATGGRRLDLRGATLLHVAAEYGEVDAARLLLDRGADVDAAALIDAHGFGGQTPLFHAVAQYSDYGVDVARLLIERGADLSIRCTLPGHYDKPDDVVTVTPLGYAARFPFGRWRTSATIDLLRQHRAPAGDVYAAARVGRVDELVSLLHAGARPEAYGPDGDSAVGAALSAGHEDAARLLADAGASIGLPEACQLGAAHRVEAILTADPSQVEQTFGDQRWTAAFYAAAANRTDVLEVLDRFRASWRTKDDHTQRTPLHVAVERGSLDAAAWLLARGVPADIRQWTGETPLHSAARGGASEAMLALLTGHGADVNAAAAAGTPLTVARRAGHEEIVEWLKAGGAREA
jgi:ankyrin repeat protein